MCLIVYSPTGANIERDVFDYAQATNSDGIGIMSMHGIEKFVGRKCRKRALRYLNKLLADHPGTPWGLHFRWATHGDVNLDNCHPYKAPESDAHVMHNGVIRATTGMSSKAKSDTAVFTDLFMWKAPGHADLGYDDFYKRVSRIIGTENKLLVFHKDTAQFTLVNENMGFWHEGLWYSNTYSVPGSIGGVYDTAIDGIGFGYGGASRGTGMKWWEKELANQDRLNKSNAACMVINGKIVRTDNDSHLPLVRDYVKLTDEEQEYADRMVSDDVPERLPGESLQAYYDRIEDEHDQEYYDAGADLGTERLMADDEEVEAIGDEDRYYRWLERKWLNKQYKETA